MVDKIILVGGFHEIIELCEDNGVQIIGIIDNHLSEKLYFEYPVIGKDNDAPLLLPQYGNIPVLITPDLPHIRHNLYNYYKQIGFNIASLISKDAYISRSAVIGEGCVIQRGVHISSKVVVGKMVKINVNANVMHDCEIDDFVTIAPNSVILGKVRIQQASYIGSNVTLLPSVDIGKCVTVGAGSVVTKSIESNRIVKGIPAK